MTTWLPQKRYKFWAKKVPLILTRKFIFPHTFSQLLLKHNIQVCVHKRKWLVWILVVGVREWMGSHYYYPSIPAGGTDLKWLYGVLYHGQWGIILWWRLQLWQQSWLIRTGKTLWCDMLQCWATCLRQEILVLTSAGPEEAWGDLSSLVDSPLHTVVFIKSQQDRWRFQSEKNQCLCRQREPEHPRGVAQSAYEVLQSSLMIAFILWDLFSFDFH